MNKFFIILFLSLFLICGCSNDNDDDDSGLVQKQCQEPQNPYSEGTGHYAGFEWAMKNGGSCDGNSESFNEGCQEYYNELDEYNDCIGNE